MYPPFLDQPPFLEIQDVTTFRRFIGKTKVLNNSFVTSLYVISTLKGSFTITNVYKSSEIQTWYNAFTKRGCQLEKVNYLKLTYIAIKERLTCIITIETVMCIMHCRKYHLHNCNRDSHLHNYNKNCHPRICCRNCYLHMCCRNF